jgi:hypothetical protein
MLLPTSAWTRELAIPGPFSASAIQMLSVVLSRDAGNITLSTPHPDLGGPYSAVLSDGRIVRGGPPLSVPVPAPNALIYTTIWRSDVSATMPVTAFLVPQGVTDHVQGAAYTAVVEQVLPRDPSAREFVLPATSTDARGREYWYVASVGVPATLTTEPLVTGVDGRTLESWGEVRSFEADRTIVLRSDQPVVVMHAGSRPPTVDCGMRDFRPLYSGATAFSNVQPVSALGRRAAVLIPEGFTRSEVVLSGRMPFTVTIDGVDRSADIVPDRGTGGWATLRAELTPGLHRILASTPISVRAMNRSCLIAANYGVLTY